MSRFNDVLPLANPGDPRPCHTASVVSVNVTEPLTPPPEADVLLENLDATQRAAVTSDAAPLAILAGAGSGKTRVLTRRIAWRSATGQIDARHVLAVTFTRKAAAELRERLRALGLRDSTTAGTFHSLAWAQLRNRWEERGIRPPTLLDRKIGFVARLLPRGNPSLPLDCTAELEWTQARDLGAADYQAAAEKAGRTPPLPMGQMIALIESYREAKLQARVVDFDDLLMLAARDIAADEDYAAAMRWRHRHLFVDEFQDINPLQHRLLRAWMGDSPDLCVVGDPNQSIYAWNGADASHLLWFEDRNPGAEIIKLGHNYRSTPQIVETGHIVLPSNARALAPPTAHRPDGAMPTVRGFADDKAEAAAIARTIRDGRPPGHAWSQQAVLTRTNAQTAVIAAALQTVDIPYRLKGGAALTAQPEVRQLLNILRSGTAPIRDALSDLRAEVAELNPGPDASRADQDRQANRDALVRLVADHAEADPDGSSEAFVMMLEAQNRNDGFEAQRDGVDIMTFHAAKGLEWQTVHVAGLERGYVPISHANDDPIALAEERRLLHVALTRAKRQLHLTWAMERQFGERTGKRSRSPYLDAIDPDGAPKETATKKSKQTQLAGVRAKLSVPVDDPVYDALTEWRRDTAKAGGVPAYVVFNNRTLAAIAEQLPETETELLEVPGVGPAKIDKYADEVLSIVAENL